MNKKIFGFVVLCFMLSFAFVACNNDDETPDSNSEWALFNDYYLDSIAAEAKANRLPGDLNNSKVTTIEKDKWSIKSYAVQPEEDLTFTPNKLQQVYIKWIKDYREDPQECIYPLYTDSVKISYKGKYVTGEVFDSNYSGEFNPEIAEPTTMALSGLIQGWAAALIYMPTIQVTFFTFKKVSDKRQESDFPLFLSSTGKREKPDSYYFIKVNITVCLRPTRQLSASGRPDLQDELFHPDKGRTPK